MGLIIIRNLGVLVFEKQSLLDEKTRSTFKGVISDICGNFLPEILRHFISNIQSNGIDYSIHFRKNCLAALYQLIEYLPIR